MMKMLQGGFKLIVLIDLKMKTCIILSRQSFAKEHVSPEKGKINNIKKTVFVYCELYQSFCLYFYR